MAASVVAKDASNSVVASTLSEIGPKRLYGEKHLHVLISADILPSCYSFQSGDSLPHIGNAKFSRSPVASLTIAIA